MVDFDDLTEQQQDAATALDRSVSLTAGAGTGKTTTLTERYLQMIERAIRDGHERGVDPEGVLGPQNILTTTFTERAADELQASIREAITERIAAEPPELFPYWRAVADDLEEGYVHTLHGFCARLLRENAFAVDGLDPGFDTLDEEETATLIDSTVDRVLATAGGGSENGGTDETEAVETLARRFDRRGLHAVLADLLGERPESVEWAKRTVELDREEYLEFVQRELHPVDPNVAAGKLADPEFVAAVETLREFVENPPAAVDTGGKAWSRAVELVDLLAERHHDGVADAEKQSTLVAVASHLTTGKGERYAGYTGAKTRWSDDDLKEEFDDAITTVVEVVEPESFAVDVDPESDAAAFPFVTALAELTLVAAEEYERVKRERNVADFTDLVDHAIRFLDSDENEATRAELREQFDYVMVDEFQDTDPRQWDLVKLLTAEDPADFDADNVFVVGDVKQSIYRFRNADVTQFGAITDQIDRTAAERGGADDETDDQLSTNFRSVSTILGVVNDLFDVVFDADGDGEAYEAPPQRLDSHRDDPAGVGHVEYLTVPTDPDLRRERFDEYEEFAAATPDDDADLEAMALAARLTRMLGEPAQVYPEEEEVEAEAEGGESDDDTPDPRDVRPTDIAVLLRSRSDLAAYERAFEDTDVPYSVASGLGFYETPEVTALVNLLRTLADPTNERALYAVLRSPLFGFTDDTLARMQHDSASLWDGLAESDSERLERAHDDLRRWRRLAGVSSEGGGDSESDSYGDGAVSETGALDGSWAALVTKIMEETGFLAAVSGDERPTQARANVEKFREELRGYGDDGIGSLTTLVGRLERRIDRSVRESEADTTGDGVQITTIHDAKGMEYPVVVVPGLGRRFNDQAALGDGRVEFERVGEQHAVGLKAPGEDAFEFEDTMARETLRERRRREERAEEKRVLYVACTRARDRLLLCGRHDSAGETDEPTLTDLEAADPEDAGSWRDWVQPELFDDELLATLDTESVVRRSSGSGEYAVSLPKSPVSIESDLDVDPRLDRSPEPPESASSVRISATEYADLVAERADGIEETVSGEDGAIPDNLSSTDTDRRRREEVSATAFGKAVHKICELRPPEDCWEDVTRQMFAAEDAGEFDADTMDRIRDHARYGIEFVDDLAEQSVVEQQYDELSVRAELDDGEVFGYVDHLLVTPSCYHIVDYKTGSVENGVEEAAREYVEQLKAYAVALTADDPARDVSVSLVFTEPGKEWNQRFDSAEIASVRDEIGAVLRSVSADSS